MFTIALVNPQIPPNTGTIARLCGATNTTLHLVGELGFDVSEPALKRAGLDYWHLVDVEQFEDTEAYFDSLESGRFMISTVHAETPYFERDYRPGDTLIFGSEVDGVPETYRNRYSDACYTLPMVNVDRGMRSINLANSASVVLYEAIRQNYANFSEPRHDIM